MGKEELLSLIAEYFISKGKKIDKDSAKVFMKYLSNYSYEVVQNAIIAEIKYGSDFPTLSKLIQHIEYSHDQRIEISWNRVLQAINGGTSGGLNEAEKKAINLITGGAGLTALIESNHYQLAKFENSFKSQIKICASGIENDVKQLSEM